MPGARYQIGEKVYLTKGAKAPRFGTIAARRKTDKGSTVFDLKIDGIGTEVKGVTSNCFKRATTPPRKQRKLNSSSTFKEPDSEDDAVRRNEEMMESIVDLEEEEGEKEEEIEKEEKEEEEKEADITEEGEDDDHNDVSNEVRWKLIPEIIQNLEGASSHHVPSFTDTYARDSPLDYFQLMFPMESQESPG